MIGVCGKTRYIYLIETEHIRSMKYGKYFYIDTFNDSAYEWVSADTV